MDDQKVIDLATAKKGALDRAREQAAKAAAAAAEARKRADQARRRVEALETRKAAPARKADAQRKILLGATLLALPDLLAQVEAKMPTETRRRYADATARATGA